MIDEPLTVYVCPSCPDPAPVGLDSFEPCAECGGNLTAAEFVPFAWYERAEAEVEALSQEGEDERLAQVPGARRRRPKPDPPGLKELQAEVERLKSELAVARAGGTRSRLDPETSEPFSQALEEDPSDPEAGQRSLGRFIVSDPRVKGGAPVIRGTRVSVSALRARIAGGDSLEELQREYDDIDPEAIREAVEFQGPLESAANRLLGRPPPSDPEALLARWLRALSTLLGEVDRARETIRSLYRRYHEQGGEKSLAEIGQSTLSLEQFLKGIGMEDFLDRSQ